MPFNGSGVFQRVRNWVADAAAGTKIRADYHDSEDDGFAQGLSNCITKDGQTIVTQNIPFNSKRATGLQDPVNPQDASTKAYADAKFGGGGVMTGNLNITKDGPALILNDTDAQGSNLIGQHHGVQRWLMRLGNDIPETGANTGSDFDLHHYADDGSYIGRSLIINRASGAWQIAGTVTVSGDLHADRDANSGVIYLGSNGTHYLYWSGAEYIMPNGPLTLGAQGSAGGHAVTLDQLNTKQANLGFTPVQQGGGAYQQANKVYIGWDNSSLRAQVDGLDLGPFAMGASVVKSTRLAFAGDNAVVLAPGGMYEPYTGAVMTGFEWTNVGYPIITYLRFRYLQTSSDGVNFYTTGYA